jgi:hypothetical protein
MRDEYAQENKLPGNPIKHATLNDFISRNYACDTSGRYFFQNGPQRVFITLDVTPWVARIIPGETGMQLLTQCGTQIDPQNVLSDELGNIYIAGRVTQNLYEVDYSESFIKKECLSVALLHDHDLGFFSDLAKLHKEACSFRGSWNWNGRELPIDPVYSQELSERFHFVKNPHA